ncbi:myelin-associated glycoprotein-like [Hyla sarda]|uniref:myelin-associated glycoprotein-like n=1 Tax=Hyla sarda TaxID=327740 RepID=UPI0024C217CA|nr:myelin-associated glycoprotein-like [Hyla sarda]
MDQRRNLFIALLLKGLQYSTAKYHSEIPKTLWAIQGSCVVIPCTYNYSDPKISSENIRGIWYNTINENTKDEVFIKSKVPKNHTIFVGDLGDGNCSIKIHNVRPENSKIYKFRVEMDHFKFSYNAIVRLTILDDPPSPILVFPNDTIPEATNVTLKCSTTYTCSSDVADLVWSSPEGHVIVTRTYQGEGVWKVESKLLFQASRDHDGVNVSCHASHHSGAKSPAVQRNLRISCKITLDWTKPILSVGGILAFLIPCVIGAAYMIRKCRLQKKKISTPNSYIAGGPIWVITTDGMMNTHDPENIYANSEFQNERDNGDFTVYANVGELKRK